MQQKVQLAGVLLHEPELLVLDEPFTGLDPVNRRLVIDIILETAGRGVAIVLSTHLMEQVEALCGRVLLLHEGRSVLEGDLRSIREARADESLWIEIEGELPPHSRVARTQRNGERIRVWLAAECRPEEFIADLLRLGVRIRRFERALPSLDEIFVEAVS